MATRDRMEFSEKEQLGKEQEKDKKTEKFWRGWICSLC